MYVYIHICILSSKYTRAYICIYLSIYLYVYVSICIHIYIYMYVYKYTYLHKYIQVHMCMPFYENREIAVIQAVGSWGHRES